jgi:hypothetical protein
VFGNIVDFTMLMLYPAASPNILHGFLGVFEVPGHAIKEMIFLCPFLSGCLMLILSFFVFFFFYSLAEH